MDLLLHLLRRGASGWYDPSLQAFHRISPPGTQQYAFAYVYGVLLRRHAPHLPLLACKALLGLARLVIAAPHTPASRTILGARLSGIMHPGWRSNA